MTPGWLQDDPGRRLGHLVYIARLFVWADRTGHPGARDHYLDLWLKHAPWNPEGDARTREREAWEVRGGLGTTATEVIKPQSSLMCERCGFSENHCSINWCGALDGLVEPDPFPG